MSNQAPKKQNGFFGNLAFNIVIPVVIMSNLSSDQYLGPAWSIVAALIFPIGYGLWDLKESGKVNAFSVLGIVSVILTGIYRDKRSCHSGSYRYRSIDNSAHD